MIDQSERAPSRDEVREVIHRALRGIGTLEFHARFGADDAADAVMDLLGEVSHGVPAAR